MGGGSDNPSGCVSGSRQWQFERSAVVSATSPRRMLEMSKKIIETSFSILT